MFRQSLEKIIDNCEGVVAALVMGFDGISVESATRGSELDVQAVGMEFSFVLGQVRKAAEILEVGDLEEVSIRSESLTFIIQVLNEEYFVGVAMKPDANFGKGRFLVRMAVPDLRAQL
jgi:predicted regulator of Ras-like GTPase activity (Roadblock/LC7/MglB family)